MQQLEWRVRLACAERHIWSAVELRRLVYRRTGIALSPQTVEACVRGLPERIDVRTLMAILNALACPLEDLIRFTPPRTESEARATPEEVVRYRRPRAQGEGPATLTASAQPKLKGRPRAARVATANQ